MTPNAEEIFNQARQRSTGEARFAYLEGACGGDAELRARVEALLRAHQSAGSFLESQLTMDPSSEGLHDAVTSASAPLREQPGTRIGPYKLLQLIGEGGFGTVFMAEQEKPVLRKVALKIIKLGMDTRQVIARFEAERQALAIMDHPNIARVFDAGATDTGRPYFVMELCKGDPIAEYCDKNSLNIEERLELFAQVCTAVQHAHTKGIIHRDIKPSNILVSTQDDRPSAKVIDFGIAKATNSKLTEKTLFTEHKQLIGTPEYMSPEQAEGSLDIDTRTDVYSLGVLLYELLTGVTPFDAKALRSAAFAEIQRMIREVDPPNPSTRLSQNTDTIASVAAKRHTEPRKLGTIVRGELDWIVMKALEKDRSRRYETANGLAMDIRRYLSGEAVVAAPPGNLYRARKFVRRNRGIVTAIGAVAAALLIGAVAFAWQARVAGNQRDIAKEEAARATAMNSFLEQMLLAADPEVSGGRDVTVLELLSKASSKADRTLQNQPMVEASVRTLLGSTFRALGRMNEASTELNRALEIRNRGAAKNTFPHAETLRALGMMLQSSGDQKGALAKFEQAQAIVLVSGEDYADEAVVGYLDLAMAQVNLSRFLEAEATLNLAEEKLKKSSRNLLENRAAILDVRSTLVAAWKDDHVQAEALAEQALVLRRQLGVPNTLAYALNTLGVMKMKAGKLDDAIPLYQEGLDLMRRELGESNPRIAMYLENLGNVYFRKNDFDRSLSLLQQALKIREAVFGIDSMPASRTRMNMGSLAVNKKDYKLALELFDAALPNFQKNVGEKSMDTAAVLRGRGAALKGLGDLDGALREYHAALAIFDAVGGPALAVRIRTLLSITEIYCDQGSTENVQKTSDLAMKALDQKNPKHEKLISEIQELVARSKQQKTP